MIKKLILAVIFVFVLTINVQASEKVSGLDTSNVNDGYVAAMYNGNGEQGYLTVVNMVTGDFHRFGLDKSGAWREYSLPYGNTMYQFSIADENNVRLKLEQVQVNMGNQLNPWLVSTHPANFRANAKSSNIAKTIRNQNSNDYDFVSKVSTYIYDNVEYDRERVLNIEMDERLNGLNFGTNLEYKLTAVIRMPDATLEIGKGICIDFSILMATMLRSEGIPAKIEFGWYTNEFTGVEGGHAWVSAYVDGKWIKFDPTRKDSDVTGNVNYVLYGCM